jgi:thiamine monophosphate synthase
VRARLLVGLSTHPRDAREPPTDDYAAFGPIFATGSKQSEVRPRLRAAARAAELAGQPARGDRRIAAETLAGVRAAAPPPRP